MADVIVIGGGVSGLGAALVLSRRGHQVTLLERDATPLPDNPDAAFAEWHRLGAPQVRHSHAFLARLRNLLRDEAPDVLEALFEAGATELRFAENMPPTIDDPSPRPGDEDLVAIACRRITFEWVLHHAVDREPNVSVFDGVGVDGLLSPGERVADPRHVIGVRTTDGRELRADLVVDASGRRSALPKWLAGIGAGEVSEEVEDTGIIYYSRFYRLLPGNEAPPQDGPIGGDLGYLKFAVFVGDNHTFSVTFGVPTDDATLRKLGHEDAFTAAANAIPTAAKWIDPSVSEPITGVEKMGGLLNRRRRLVVDGRPVALGIHAIGDALVCTNPLYGRGCSLGLVHAWLLADVIQQHPDDLEAQALAFEEATERELVPWYEASVTQDRMARATAARAAAGDTEPDPDDPMGSIMRDGLMPAVRYDAVVWRAFVRTFNLLDPPAKMLEDGDVVTRILAAYNDRDNRPEPEALGPPRKELVGLLT
jgi:2-polyprenyl-6-methoxyphenol hydroxylase-like FAD-dependent oxidoreductase